MNKNLRYISACILGFFISVFIWRVVVSLDPFFWKLNIFGLIAPILACVLGGLVISLLSPKHKILLSISVGLIFTIPLLLFLLRNGFSHLDRNSFLWYWPIYITPSFILGSFLGKKLLELSRNYH